jgi:signal transduction histidine kinase
LAEVEALGQRAFGEAFRVFERDADGQAVALGEREVYFPILYVEPMAGNEAAHGLDAGFTDSRRAVLTEAWHSGKATASAPIRLVQETGTQFGVLLYQPIYTDILPPTSEQARVETLVGLVPVVLRVGSFVEATLQNYDTHLFNLRLSDPQAPDLTLFALTHSTATPDERDLSVVIDIAIANRTWALAFVVPAAVVDGNIEYDGALVPYIILGLTALVLLYLYQRNQVEGRLRRYAATLEAANRELDAYSYTLAHDLKSPLALISGYAYLLENEKLSPDGREMLRSMVSVGEQMAKMTDDLLQLAKLRDAEATMALVTMVEAVEAALKRFETQRAYVTIEGTLPDALGHAPWVVEVFANLIGNAFKYTPDDRTPNIRIRGAVHGDRVRYEVQDNGVGIAQPDQRRIFEMFARLPNTDKQRGLGLGLSIVQRIVERLGGTVGVTSTPEQGSTFWFTLKRP